MHDPFAQKNRGRRESRVPAAPAASRANLSEAHERSHRGFTGVTRPSLRNGFTAYFVLSPATNSSCHRRPRIKVLPDPVGPTCLRELDTSNGCQNHTALPFAKAPFVSRVAKSLTRFISPCDCHCTPCALASTASRPAFVTTRDPPPLWDRTAGDIEVIWVSGGAKYFCKGGWTGQPPDGQITCNSEAIDTTAA